MAKRVLPKALAFLAVSVAPTPALAQAMTSAVAGSLSWSKSEAILGGEPSALEAILARQSGEVIAPRVSVQPASYSYARPMVVNAAVRSVSPGVWNGRPDVFGSVALRIDHSPLDARWKLSLIHI